MRGSPGTFHLRCDCFPCDGELKLGEAVYLELDAGLRCVVIGIDGKNEAGTKRRC